MQFRKGDLEPCSPPKKRNKRSRADDDEDEDSENKKPKIDHSKLHLPIMLSI